MPKITVLKVSVTPGPAGKNYKICEVGYKTDEGKVKGMRILDFVQKDVFAVAEKLKAGDIVDATFSQNDKSYWQFNSLTPTGESGSVAQPATSGETPAKSGGNWETKEERAKRQVMIVRQSQLSNAIAYFTLTGHKKATQEEVMLTAQLFENFVINGEIGVTVTGDVE